MPISAPIAQKKDLPSDQGINFTPKTQFLDIQTELENLQHTLAQATTEKIDPELAILEKERRHTALNQYVTLALIMAGVTLLAIGLLILF